MTSVARYRYVTVDSVHPLAVGLKARSDGRTVIAEHRLVLFDKIGPGMHPCHWCGAAVEWGSTLRTDHIDNDGQNNDPSNLVASCHGCNTRRAGPLATMSPNVGSGRRGEANGRSRLTSEQVTEIRRRYTGAPGEQTQLAREFGIQKAQLSKIVNGQSWKGLGCESSA
jgi:hypothetical protein